MKKDDLITLHSKYSNGKYKNEWVDIVWTHSQIVLLIALKIVKNLEKKEINVDKTLLEEGILLHDIGVYSCYDEELNPDHSAPQYIQHGLLGYEILKNEGFDESISRFAKSHTGTGLTKEDIVKGSLPLPKEDMIPITLEEEILCYADKFHTKYPAFSSFEEQKLQLAKYSERNEYMMENFCKKFGIPDTTDIQKKYNPWNQKIDKFLSNI